MGPIMHGYAALVGASCETNFVVNFEAFFGTFLGSAERVWLHFFRFFSGF